MLGDQTILCPNDTANGKLTQKRYQLGRSSSVPATTHDNARMEFRSGLSDLLSHLDVQCADRRKEAKKSIESEVAWQAMKKKHAESLKDPPEAPAWIPNDPPGFFEKPRPPIEQGQTVTHGVKNRVLQGMYDTPYTKPPHFECNVPGMWDPHATNDRGAVMDYLGHPHREWPEKHIVRMGPNEKKFFDRRTQKLADIKKEEEAEAKLRTTGSHKKMMVLANAGEHSSLKRTKPAWNDQSVSNHTYFAQYAPDQAGDNQYLTGLKQYVEQPVRAMSYERDFIAGDPLRTTYWKAPPPGKVSGSQEKHRLAQELLCPIGCPSLSPSGTAKRIVNATATTSPSGTRAMNGKTMDRTMDQTKGKTMDRTTK